MNNLTLGSLFDGSGGFPLGGMLSGITPIWASEIEPFPIMVTSKRLPNVKHYGDISKMNGGEIEPVDIITFGSPCQDLSIAGTRTGLDGKRSGLFYEAIRIVKEMREKTDGKYPRYIVWENVAGAFSSNKGEDFRCVLEEISKVKDAGVSIPECKKWKQAGYIVGDEFSVAWRLLDAEFWGVPQRRKRIYLVADFAGTSASKILFESEGLSGYSPESQRAWQEATRSFGKGTDSSVGIAIENHPTDGRVKIDKDNIVQTLASRMGTGGNNVPLVMEEPRCFDVRITSLGTKNIRANLYETETARTIDTGGNSPDSNQGGVAVVALEGNGQRPSHQGDGYKEGEVMYTLNGTEQHGVAYGIDRAAFNQGKNARFDFTIEEEVEPTVVARGPGAVAMAKASASLSAADGPKGPSSQQMTNPEENFALEPTYSTSKASYHTEAEKELANTLVATDFKDPPIVNDKPSYGFYPQMKAECVTMTEEKSGCLVNGTNPGYQNGVIEPDYIVRRLTPIECARLQGFPDFWCDDLGCSEPTEEDIKNWSNIFDAYNNALGKTSKPKSESQIIKWLKDPYSDSAAYKMWGNGVALPCVVFVLSGIVWASSIE